MYFTLAASCLRHEIDPFAYLRDLLTRLPQMLADTAGHPAAAELRQLLSYDWPAQPQSPS